ncbi:hypothetical protein DOT_3224 [Desulfosporosinus sp. OT]|nr:hypothetical protein DOT_3224 [Desulfosporosinus sp. OT]
MALCFFQVISCFNVTEFSNIKIPTARKFRTVQCKIDKSLTEDMKDD